jgi:hypothetical protein
MEADGDGGRPAWELTNTCAPLTGAPKTSRTVTFKVPPEPDLDGGADGSVPPPPEPPQPATIASSQANTTGPVLRAPAGRRRPLLLILMVFSPVCPMRAWASRRTQDRDPADGSHWGILNCHESI